MYFYHGCEKLCVNYLSIASIGLNIASNKATEQFPDNFGGGTSDKAVDGYKRHALSADMCAHTNWFASTTVAWWRVDLGDWYILTGVKIFNRDQAGMFLL